MTTEDEIRALDALTTPELASRSSSTGALMIDEARHRLRLDDAEFRPLFALDRGLHYERFDPVWDELMVFGSRRMVVDALCGSERCRRDEW